MKSPQTVGEAAGGPLDHAIMSERPPASIKTPCVQVCVMDDESGLCLGCLRTLAEVAGWSRFTDAERARIMAGLADRRGRISPGKLSTLG